jgi:hypothetical protein
MSPLRRTLLACALFLLLSAAAPTWVFPADSPALDRNMLEAPASWLGAPPSPPKTGDRPGIPFLRLGEDWSRDERSLVWSYVALSAVDAYQTIQQPPGFVEMNPAVAAWAGERPNAAELVLFKTATTYGLVRLVDRLAKTPRQRKVALSLLNSVQLSVTIHNEKVTGGILTP